MTVAAVVLGGVVLSRPAQSQVTRGERELAAADQAAWVASMQTALAAADGDVVWTDDTARLDEPSDCPTGTVPWNRSEMITICAGLCETDADCADDEKCRVLSPALGPEEPVVLASDVDLPLAATENMSAEAMEARLVAVEKAANDRHAMRVCDPFWTEHGALSAVGREPRDPGVPAYE